MKEQDQDPGRRMRKLRMTYCLTFMVLATIFACLQNPVAAVFIVLAAIVFLG